MDVQTNSSLTDQVLSVSEMTASVKDILESNFPNVAIQGEISNFKRQSSGHLYFSLKDSHAQISGVMWKGSAQRLSTMPKDGDQVIVQGELNVYPPRGSYQVVAREIHFVGLGELLIKLEALKREIARRGWFGAEHKKPLPTSPKRIGVVTSPTGAAIRDIINVLKRRYRGFSLLINPVRVQGAESAFEIAQAIKQFNAHKLADVLIVGRGGGSLEDLFAFNEEIVAEAIFNSEIPIICAVGHESDHTIAEYVADIRAPTPSAAAEIVALESAQQVERLEALTRRLHQTQRHLIRNARQRLERFSSHPYLSDPYAILGPYMQRLDGYQRQLALLDPRAQVQRSRERLNSLVGHLQALDPRNVLKKGYSLLFDENNKGVITSKKQLNAGQTLRALLGDGEARLEVIDE